MQGKTVAGFDKLVNLTEVIVSTGYDASATTIDLQAGEGTKVPDPATYGSFYGMYYDATANLLASDDANREWVLFTAKSSDQVTITRGQQETAASTKNELGHQYRIALVLSAAQMEKYNQLQNSGMSRQAVLNSNFNIWGNGTSYSNPANNSTTADKWKAGFVLATGTFPTIVHSRQSLTSGDVFGSFYNYRINTNGAGTSLASTENYKLYQDIVGGTRFLAGASKQVTISFYAKSSIASKKIGINLIQSYGTGGSPTADETITGDNITLTSSWKFYSFTYTLNTLVGKTFGTNNDDYIRLQLWTMWQSGTQSQVGASSSESFGGSGNVEFAQVQICSGDVALEYRPKLAAYEYSEMYGVSLFDGSDVSTHYHSTDRNRVNHTGTQALSTIRDTGTAGETLAANDLVYFKSSDSKYWKAVDGADSWNATHIVYTGGASGATVDLVPLEGRISLASNLTANTTYYRSATGTLTSTHPSLSSSSHVPLRIGRTDAAGNLVCERTRLQRRILTTQAVSGTSNYTVTVGFHMEKVIAHMGYSGTATNTSMYASGYYDVVGSTQKSINNLAALVSMYVSGAAHASWTASVVANDLVLTYAGTTSPFASTNVILEIYEAIS